MLTKKTVPTTTADIAKKIKESIESVFKDGIDGLPFVQTDGLGGFTGKFKAHGEYYDFFITKDGGISYNEADTRTDSAYIQGYLASQSRTDKAKMCDRGKPCGNTCIAKGISCRRQLSGSALSSLKAAQQALSFEPSSEAKSAAIGMLTGAATGLLIGAAVVGVGMAGVDASKNSQLIKEMNSAASAAMWDTTPQVNQNYDSIFPSQEEFSKAKFDNLVPVSSGSAQQGTHAIFKTKIKSSDFFVKKATEMAIAKEVSSYEIAKELGLGDNVLPAARIYKDKVPFVANPLLNKELVVDLGNEEKIKKTIGDMDKQKLSKLLLYDYTIHNHDRHSGNVLFKPNNDIYLIDHGAMRWDLPDQISSKLDSKQNIFLKYGFKNDRETRLPKKEIDNILDSRKKIRDTLEYRYAGQSKHIVNPILEKFDDRMDVLQEMSSSGDTRISRLIEGKKGLLATSQTQVFSKKSIPNLTINGVKLETTDSHYYLGTPDAKINEPAYPQGAKNKKVGVTIMERDGQTWLYEPSNRAGAKNALSQGNLQEGLSAQQSALKDAREKLGLQIKIVDHLGDFNKKGEKLKTTDKDKTVTRQYLAIRTGGAPWDAHEKSSSVKLVAPNEAHKLLDTPRDRKVFDYANKHTTSPKGLEVLKKAHNESEKERSKWKASMSAKEAEKWVKNSAWKDTVFHATHQNSVEPISKNGFNLGIRKVGRAYGNGVYFGLEPDHVEGYRKLYGDKGSEGTTMQLKVNVNKVMDIDRELEKAKRRDLETAKKRNKLLPKAITPETTMREIARSLKSLDTYDTQVKYIERENLKIKKMLAKGEITKEDYDNRHILLPQFEAFSTVAQRAGYDAIKTTGGRNRIPMLVVYDPKKVTVIGKERG